jgi:hypothetical protein
LFLWNAGAERYIAPSGRFVSRAAVRAALDATLDVQMARARTLSTRLTDGEIDLGTWRQGMTSAIKTAHLEGAAVARGGWAQLSQADLEWTARRVHTHLGYLGRFHDDLAFRPDSVVGVAARSEMYIEAGRGTQREMERRMAVQRGRDLEKNVLGGSRDPCGQCPALSDLGYVPVGTLPEVGQRQCLTRCHCHLIFRTSTPTESRAASNGLESLAG